MHIGILSEQDKQALERGMRIANVAVIETVTSECVLQRQPNGTALYDTRPMVDPHEHSPANVDWHVELLSYGESVGLLRRDTTDRHMVAFVRQAKT